MQIPPALTVVDVSNKMVKKTFHKLQTELAIVF